MSCVAMFVSLLRSTCGGSRQAWLVEPSHADAPLTHDLLRLPNRVLAEMENTGRQRRIRLAHGYRVGQMLRLARAAAGDDWYGNRLAHRAGNFEIVAVLCAVGVHAGEHDFAGAE